jgi:hypothetical protein
MLTSANIEIYSQSTPIQKGVHRKKYIFFTYDTPILCVPREERWFFMMEGGKK